MLSTLNVRLPRNYIGEVLLLQSPLRKNEVSVLENDERGSIAVATSFEFTPNDINNQQMYLRRKKNL